MDRNKGAKVGAPVYYEHISSFPIFSSSVSKKKSSYCDFLVIVVVDMQKLANKCSPLLKSIKGINTKLGILAQLQDKGHNSESDSVGVIPLFNLKNRMMAPD